MGDTPELTKLMGLIRHNSYQDCRYCNLRDVYINHIYYPTTPSKNLNSARYQASNLPNRTYEEWRRRLKIIQKAKLGKE
ncbi:12422_t:CDS:1 [Cetraspora pellucida]|uniref:12422_t:CDS:1 n=1 Tax=Cetraspora pellucida TaxID=1433469 RepID=A0A9N9DCB2_9GLOM|nr:12422_t:CDS:1 [Cetraspora pellucida]